MSAENPIIIPDYTKILALPPGEIKSSPKIVPEDEQHYPDYLLPSAIKLVNYLEQSSKIYEQLIQKREITADDLDSAISIYPWEESATQINRYQIGTQIDSGGLGDVFIAQDTLLNQKCCIKKLKADKANDTKYQRLFLREALLLMVLDHPNIVHGQNVFIHKDETYLVMDYIPDPSLRKRIYSEGVLSPEQTFDVIKDAASAIGYLHSRGIVYRDFKADNLLSGNKNMLIDLGVSSAVYPHDSNTLVGTVGYISPNDFIDDPSKDVLSMGATIYGALTGDTDGLFTRTTLVDSLATVGRRETFIPTIGRMTLNLKNKGYNNAKDFGLIIDRATHPDQFSRYSSMNELISAFEIAIKNKKGKSSTRKILYPLEAVPQPENQPQTIIFDFGDMGSTSGSSVANTGD